MAVKYTGLTVLQAIQNRWKKAHNAIQDARNFTRQYKMDSRMYTKQYKTNGIKHTRQYKMQETSLGNTPKTDE